MNFNQMPELHYKYGYFIALGAMALILIITLIYFKKKGLALTFFKLICLNGC